MKKLILISAFLLLAGSIFCQVLPKGTFVGFHVYTITLSPGVTMEQFTTMWKKDVGPVYEKEFNCKAYWLKGVRGECPDCIAGMIVWKTEADRDRYFFKEGGLNETGQAAMARCQPAIDKLNKLGTSTSKYTDWVIQ